MPVKGTVVGEFAASLVRVRFAEAVPEALGVNTTFAFILCPAAMVTGSARPDRTNSELFTFAAEMVTGPFDAANVRTSLAESPTVTLPKFRLEGETPSLAAVAFTPVPDTPKISLGLVASLIRVIVPAIFPLTRGLKLTGNRVLFPAARVNGSGKFPKEKLLPFFHL